MKEKQLQLITVSLFCGFLGLMSLLYWILPEKNFSDREKRFLEEFPAVKADTVLSGEWGEKTETYLADHMPGRDFFVGVNAYFDLATGRQQTKDIRILDHALVEAPVNAQQSNLSKNLRAATGFAEKTQIPVDLMLIPTAGWVREGKRYPDEEILSAVEEKTAGKLSFLDLSSLFEGEDFYLTDHHWTSGGAWKAYDAYITWLGREPQQDFQVESHPGFRGSTYARSGLWLTPGEPIELWQGSGEILADYENTTHSGVFDRKMLDGPDMYTVFLGGNHPLVTLKNPGGQGKLLVIRDSFSNCLGGFLAESFAEVTMVDLRYYKQSISALVESGNFDRVLICYGLSNFMSDSNLIFLTR